ncbi:MAG: hypothetical protein H6719_27460 [Sandaracinaceae bacterium]|nr:hypothetical protein [Sandaracinaceae bacterium]
MLGGLITIAGGLIAASNLIVSRLPNAKEMLDKLSPYQGWIGVVMFGWGIWETISCVLGISLLAAAPLTWVFWLCVALADLFVGFLLGFGLITKYALSKNEDAMQKGTRIRAKIAPFQGLLGLFAVVMGALYLVWLVVL